MSWRTNLKLLVAAVALTVYYRAYEAGLPSWQQKGRVFPGLEPSRIVELDLSWPQTAEDASLGVDARSVSLRYESFEGSERQWWIVEPFRFRALHPRVQGLVYSVADMVRVAQVEGEDEFFESKPTVRVRFALDDGSEHVVEIGSDYPDASLKFCYARVDDTVFWTKQDLKSSFAVALEQLRGRALFPVPPQEVVSLSVDGAERVAKLRRDTLAPLDLRLRRHMDELHRLASEAARQTPPPLRQRSRARVVKAVEGVPEEAAADEPRHKFAAQRAAAAARRRQQ